MLNLLRRAMHQLPNNTPYVVVNGFPFTIGEATIQDPHPLPTLPLCLLRCPIACSLGVFAADNIPHTYPKVLESENRFKPCVSAVHIPSEGATYTRSQQAILAYYSSRGTMPPVTPNILLPIATANPTSLAAPVARTNPTSSPVSPLPLQPPLPPLPLLSSHSCLPLLPLVSSLTMLTLLL